MREREKDRKRGGERAVDLKIVVCLSSNNNHLNCFNNIWSPIILCSKKCMASNAVDQRVF